MGISSIIVHNVSLFFSKAVRYLWILRVLLYHNHGLREIGFVGERPGVALCELCRQICFAATVSLPATGTWSLWSNVKH